MRCVVSGSIPPVKLKKSHSPQEKHSDPMGSQRNELESSWGVYNLSLGDPSPGEEKYGVG